MREISETFGHWLEAASREAEPDDEPSSVDLLAAAFRRLPPGAQQRVRRRLLDDCLRVLAAVDALRCERGASALRASGDERRVLEHMCDVLLTTVALDVH